MSVTVPNLGNLYLLFEDGQIGGERAIMPASELVECGTPITEQGDDMEYAGYTTDTAEAVAWVNEANNQ